MACGDSPIAIASIVALLFGCGGGSGRPDADAGPGDASTFEPEPPTEPAYPTLTPCPDGWREVVDPDDPALVTCAPFGGAATPECTGDEAIFPGETACHPIGEPCPAGDYSEEIPAGSSVLYVLAGAALGGDGSIAAPFATLAGALAASADGDVVALSKGTFDEAVGIRRRVTIWGACVAETIVASSTSDPGQPTLAIFGTGGVVVRNLQVSGPRVGIDVASTADTSRVESVLVAGARFVGVGVHDGGTLEAEELVVRDTETDGGGNFGTGIDVFADGSTATLNRVAVERNHRYGISSNSHAVVSATEVLVRGTAMRDDGQYGFGVNASDGGQVDLERAVIDGNHGAGVFVQRAAATVSDSILRGTLGNSPDFDGSGVEVADGGTATVRRTTLLGNGMHGDGPDFALVADDVAVVDLVPSADGSFGHGMDFAGGGSMDLARVVLARCLAAGVLLRDLETGLVAEDLRIRTVLPEAIDGSGGLGIQATAGAHVELRRASIEETQDVALLAHDRGTEVLGADVAVRAVASGTDGRFGRGLDVTRGATVQIDRITIEDAHDAGAVTMLDSASIVLSDLVLERTVQADCAPSCEALGCGLAVANDSSVVLTRFRVSHNAVCGVQVSTGATMDLTSGEISQNPIGANVQDPDFDLARLQNDVAFVDNDVPLDASSLPLPDTMESF